VVRVMFVDDEPQILSGLRRMLRKERSEWHPEFVTSGREALARMEEAPFDVLVTDMRMPEMSGLELLAAVKERHPETVRLVLSGHADQEMTLKAVGLAHQYLSKPCDPEALRTAVQRSLRLRIHLADLGLKQAVSGLDFLPTLPSIYTRVVAALRDPNQTLRDVGAIVAEDIGLTAKILQVVNSSFFGLAREVSTPQEAAVLLGGEIVTSLVLGAKLFDGPASQMPALEGLWRGAVTTASRARAIADRAGLDRRSSEHSYVAGMLHHVGKLVLLDRHPTLLTATADEEERAIGTHHGLLGAYLLDVWGLPDPVVEAVGFHDRPLESPTRSFGPLAAVHLAIGLCGKDCHLAEPDPEFLAELEIDLDAYADLAEADDA